MSSQVKKRVGLPTIKRLPLYLRILQQMEKEGVEYASGAVVAKKLMIDPIVVRKDLATTGAVGRPRLGFPLHELIVAIQQFLGWTNNYDAILVGVGGLGSALLKYDGFKDYGLRIVAAFDTDPQCIGKVINGVVVESPEQLSLVVLRLHIKMGIIAVPAAVAQSVTNRMVAANIKGIWNFTPVKLDVPEDVVLQREDLAASLAVLSHQLNLLNT